MLNGCISASSMMPTFIKPDVIMIYISRIKNEAILLNNTFIFSYLKT